MGETTDSDSDDTLRALFQRVVDGDLSARNEIVLAAVPVVAAVAATFLRRRDIDNEALAEEMRSEGALSLLRLIDATTIAEGLPRSIIGVMTRRIHRACQAVLDNEPLIGFGHMMAKYRRAGANVGRVRSAACVGEDIDDFAQPGSQHETAVDFAESLGNCCKSPADCLLVDLRIAGKCDAEIAVEFGCSEEAIRQRRKRIEARFEQHSSALSA